VLLDAPSTSVTLTMGTAGVAVGTGWVGLGPVNMTGTAAEDVSFTAPFRYTADDAGWSAVATITGAGCANHTLAHSHTVYSRNPRWWSFSGGSEVFRYSAAAAPLAKQIATGRPSRGARFDGYFVALGPWAQYAAAVITVGDTVLWQKTRLGGASCAGWTPLAATFAALPSVTVCLCVCVQTVCC
jgi:hypothetical protein